MTRYPPPMPAPRLRSASPSARTPVPTLTAARLLCAAMLLPACTRDTMLLESDVPLPRGMSTVRSADIRRDGGTVTGGDFILAGEIDDARSAIRASAQSFEANGWTIVRADGSGDAARGEFVKDTRIVSVTLRRRALEPKMSTGTLTVRREG